MPNRSTGRHRRARALLGLALGLLVLRSLGGCAGEAEEGAAPGAEATRAFVDSTTCAECHPFEAEAWAGSHHDEAMQRATAETVLGDFSGVEFEHLGLRARFFEEDGRFWVHTEGLDGTYADFEIGYTFGVEPLQQYLVDFPGGRKQCLTIAWDTEEERWYSLYPDERYEPGDPLHWTGRYQSWNLMCAECHSTALDKGYDAASDTYRTTWHEIDVGCQACHGPGARHVEWARAWVASGAEYAGALSAREKGLDVTLRRGEAGPQLDACARCHARRHRLVGGAYEHGTRFVDAYEPQRLLEGYYHADGQIQDEVYVWGSFVQSKMHARGVACTDCHDPHSLELQLTGDALCTQCHSKTAPLERFPTLTAKSYDVREHHHHDPDQDGARCVNCHMPAKHYMVVDPRRDHSFRIPRPDLTAEIGTPNACNGCHADQDAAWAADAIASWFGLSGRAEPGFAVAFHRARQGDRGAGAGLERIVQSEEQAAIVRATAVEYLGRLGVGLETIGRAIDDDDPLVRASAIRALDGLPPELHVPLVQDALDDPARAVRIEAGRALSAVPTDAWTPEERSALDTAVSEFLTAQRESADAAWAHLNLGVFHADRQEHDAALRAYRRAIELDPWFLPARFNAANLLNGLGRNDEAEAILRAGLELVPDEGELAYSLALLLAEEERFDEAARLFADAIRAFPRRARARYNRALVLRELDRDAEAERELLEARALDPDDPDVLHALILLYGDQDAWKLALPHARELVRLLPDAPFARQLLQRVERELE